MEKQIKKYFCPICQTEVNKKDKTCPNCGEKLSKPFYKKWWFWVIVAVVLIAAIGGSGSDSKKTNNNVQNQAKTGIKLYDEAFVPNTDIVGQTYSAKDILEHFEKNGYLAKKDDEGTSVTVIDKDEKEVIINGQGSIHGLMFKTNEKSVVTSIVFARPEVEGLLVEILYDEKSNSIKYIAGNNEVKSLDEITKYVIDNFNITEEKIAKIEEESIPTEYKNALKKAQSYSDRMYFSYAKLYDQLTSEYGEGFTPEAAQYAVDNVIADWNYNALQKAIQYQQDMSMSTSRIYDQLVSEYGENFTAEQAQYAIDNLPE